MQCFAAGLVIMLQLYVLGSVAVLVPLSAINNTDNSIASQGCVKLLLLALSAQPASLMEEYTQGSIPLRTGLRHF